MYVIKLYQGTRLLKEYTSDTLAIAGKMYANPGVLVPYEQYEKATRVHFLAPKKAWPQGWSRNPHNPGWFLGIEGPDYFEVKDLRQAGWKENHIETMQSQMKLWYPDMEAWLAMDIIRQVKNHILMGMSIWIVVEEIQAYPRAVEIRKLAKAQEEDQNEA